MPDPQGEGCQGGGTPGKPAVDYPLLFPGLLPWRPPGTNEAERREVLLALAAQLLSARGDAPENHQIPAGYTYFGQFMNHDLSRMQPIGVAGSNLRSPAFDLDSVYGTSPEGRPADLDGQGRFRPRADVSAAGPDEHDLRRTAAGEALIPEPRNDEHVILSQLHVSVHRFHNAVMAWLERHPGRVADVRAARAIVRRHYQWVVLHDYLPTLAGQELIDEMVPDGQPPKLRHYATDGPAFIPREFAAGVFRVGHSMVRASYRLSARTPPLPLFLEAPTASHDDLRGGRPLPKGWRVNWSYFLERSLLHRDGSHQRAASFDCQPSMALDLSMVNPLDQLPGTPPTGRSLILRDLEASLSCRLPSGQDVARELGIEPLTNQALGLGALLPESSGCPLLLYALGEAQLSPGEPHLGPVGGRLLAETVLGVMSADKSSIVHDPGWTPQFAVGGEFLLSDFVRSADRLDQGHFDAPGARGGLPGTTRPVGGDGVPGQQGVRDIAAD